MSLVIPINSTQEEFELLLQKNPDVTELNCDYCTSLTSIPQLNNLTRLYCDGCISLTSIPQLDNLKQLYCHCCTSLTSIPQLDKLELLDCSYCTSLTSIPQLDKLELLDCDNCTSFTIIPQLDKLEVLYWDSCTNLCVKNIGYLPKLKTCGSEFKNQNEYYYKLTLIRPNISRAFGKYKGFTDDFMRILETY
jgi:Leucine-rich repeat (LRR) protein